MQAPIYETDYFGDAFIRDPLPHYEAMRALGPVVFLPDCGNYAVVRYKELREALENIDDFTSGRGVSADDAGCAFMAGNTLASDPPEHDLMRKALIGPLLPGQLKKYQAWMDSAAQSLVDELCERRSFDGVADVARHLPLTVVTELVGLPEDGRENMLDWAAASFDIHGVQNDRGRNGMELIKDMRQWIVTRARVENLKPGSWTARAMQMEAEGSIPEGMGKTLVRDYINPSLDTTISATGELLLQLARNPDQLELIRQNDSLIPRAVDEALRLATPIRSFSRTVAHDAVLGGVDIPRGSRLMVVFASANRDPDHFPNPDVFDVQRSPRDHVAFGYGIHICAGLHLARMEMTTLLRALAPRIKSLEAGEPTVSLNNTIRGFATMPMHLTPQ